MFKNDLTKSAEIPYNLLCLAKKGTAPETFSSGAGGGYLVGTTYIQSFESSLSLASQSS